KWRSPKPASVHPFELLFLARGKARRRAAAARNHGLRRDLDERAQDERALVHARMRYHELRLVDAGIAVEQEIEVERARGIGEAALPPVPRLDRLELAQEFPRPKGGVQLGDRVDEVGLRGIAHRCAAIERRARAQARAR